jgi:hypothetical protein
MCLGGVFVVVPALTFFDFLLLILCNCSLLSPLKQLLVKLRLKFFILFNNRALFRLTMHYLSVI